MRSFAEETLRMLARPWGLAKMVLAICSYLAFLFISFRNLFTKVVVDS